MGVKARRASAATVKTQEGPAVPSNRLAGRLLDARRDRLDLRDRVYTPRVESLERQYPDDRKVAEYLGAYTQADLILDQGSEGACTGFGLACVVNFLRWTGQYKRLGGRPPRGFDQASPRMIYHLARMYDEWPGEDYEGSSNRGALKGWHKHGVCAESLWPYRDGSGKIRFVPPADGWAQDALRRTLGVYYRIDKNSVVDMQAAIQEIGAIYASADVHRGWQLDSTRGKPVFANLPVIRRGQEPPDGGHAFALVGFNETGFVVQNSWGREWGLGGFALLTYEDWVELGYDAWACALGVPKEAAASPVASRGVFQRSAPAGDLRRRIGVSVAAAAADGARRLPVETAYRRTVVFGNDGYVERRIVEHADVDDTVARLGNDIPAAVFDAWKDGGEPRDRLLIYAHGGLNSEAASIERIRALGQAFEDNRIYPLFLTWKTGVQETIAGIVEDKLTEIVGPAAAAPDWIASLKDAAIEAKDRALEVAARQIVVRALWEQMKQNAQAAAEAGRGGHRLAAALAKLVKARRGRLEIHLVGHSAGAILLGHLLPLLPGAVASCTLYAPACTVEFANRTYRTAVDQGKLDGARLQLHVLSDERERADTVGPYGKSLLYLVSRALERVHKTPILGLRNCFDPAFNGSPQWNDEERTEYPKAFAKQLRDWQEFWGRLPGAAAERLVVESRASVSMGSAAAAGSTPAVHGCFDNHAEVVARTMALILGRAPSHPPENLSY